MEFYYKPLNQAYDKNSILSIVGVDPGTMDEETLLEHGLYLVEDQDRDPYLFTSGEYLYRVQESKALRFVIDSPIELSEAKRIGELKILEFFNLEFPVIISNNSLSSELLLGLYLVENTTLREVLASKLHPVELFMKKMTEALVNIQEAEDFQTVKQIVISACARN